MSERDTPIADGGLLPIVDAQRAGLEYLLDEYDALAAQATATEELAAARLRMAEMADMIGQRIGAETIAREPVTAVTLRGQGDSTIRGVNIPLPLDERAASFALVGRK